MFTSLRCVSSLSRTLKLSLAVVFVDIRAAFAVVIRALIFDQPMSDEYIASVFKRLNFLPGIFDKFCETVRDTNAMTSAKVPPELRYLTRSFSSLSYFHTKGVDKVCVYKGGTCAGTPLADLLFSFLMARVLSLIQGKLAALGITHVLPAMDRSLFASEAFKKENFYGSSYVDDNFFVVQDKSPLSLRPKLELLILVVIETFAFHSLPCNLDYGKTGIVLHLRGKGKNDFKFQVDENDRQYISVKTLSMVLPVFCSEFL